VSKWIKNIEPEYTATADRRYKWLPPPSVSHATRSAGVGLVFHVHYGLDDRGSISDRGNDGIFSPPPPTASRPALGPIQPPIKWATRTPKPGFVRDDALRGKNVKIVKIWSGVPEGTRNQDKDLTDQHGQL
jgi:hypothetical protein